MITTRIYNTTTSTYFILTKIRAPTSVHIPYKIEPIKYTGTERI